MGAWREKWLGFVVLILLASASGVEAQEPKTVKVGHFVATNSGGLYIAQDRGYFAEQGIRAVFEASPCSRKPSGEGWGSQSTRAS